MLIPCLVWLAVFTVSTVAQYMALDQTMPTFQAFDWNKKNEWVGRTNAMLAQLGILLFAAITGHTTQWGASLALAYFIHDGAHLLLYDHDITNYVHHIVAGFVTILRETVMTSDQSFSTFLATCVLESTSPVLNATWLLKEAGYKEHPIFKYLAGFAVVFFGLMRLGIFPWLVYSKMDKVTTSIFAPIIGLNIFWFYKLVRMARKALSTNSGGDLRE